MVNELLVLNSSYVGSRDLWWVDDPEATKGYNIYRAYDHPSNWKKLNNFLWRGHFWRDQAALEEVEYIVKDVDWVERGELGRWGFKLPDIPYSDVVHFRPKVATSPDDVRISMVDIGNNIVDLAPLGLSIESATVVAILILVCDEYKTLLASGETSVTSPGILPRSFLTLPLPTLIK